jgi:hypothetical protein
MLEILMQEDKTRSEILSGLQVMLGLKSFHASYMEQHGLY